MPGPYSTWFFLLWMAPYTLPFLTVIWLSFQHSISTAHPLFHSIHSWWFGVSYNLMVIAKLTVTGPHMLQSLLVLLGICSFHCWSWPYMRPSLHQCPIWSYIGKAFCSLLFNAISSLFVLLAYSLNLRYISDVSPTFQMLSDYRLLPLLFSTFPNIFINLLFSEVLMHLTISHEGTFNNQT